MPTRQQVQPGRRIFYAPPALRAPLPALSPTPRPAAVVIADLLRPRLTPTRSREEQAFIELQRGCAT